MAWQLVTDRGRIRRAENLIGAPLDALWAWHPTRPSETVHTRAYRCRDGRTGWLYSDGYVEWDDRGNGPWADPGCGL